MMRGTVCAQCNKHCDTMTKGGVSIFCSLACLHAYCRAKGWPLPVPI